MIPRVLPVLCLRMADSLEEGPTPGSFGFESICPVSSPLPAYSETNLAVWELTNTHYHLASAHVQLAIRQYLHGPRYGFAVDSLSYTEVRVPEFEVNWSLISERSLLFREQTIRVASIDACVFPSPASLCLRVQSLQIGHEKIFRAKTLKMRPKLGGFHTSQSVRPSQMYPAGIRGP
jgi:hypothetical protein